MKSFLFFLLAVFPVLIGFTACSSDDEPIPSIGEMSDMDFDISHNDEVPNEDPGMFQFLQSVDSLNNAYALHATRGFGGSMVKALADEAGRAGGKVLFRWLGASIGAAAANPVLASLGYVGGQYIGGIIGSAAASALAELYFTNAGHNNFPQGSLRCVYDLNIRPTEITRIDLTTIPFAEDPRVDSIGYYHNNVMVQINKDKQTFIRNGQIEISTLLRRIVYEYKKYGIDATPLTENPNVISIFMTKMDQVGRFLAERAETCGNLSSFINDAGSIIHSAFKLSASELDLFRQYSAKIAIQCENMSEQSIHLYAKDLNRIIIHSNLSYTNKYEASTVGQVIINSSLCWKQ